MFKRRARTGSRRFASKYRRKSTSFRVGKGGGLRRTAGRKAVTGSRYAKVMKYVDQNYNARLISANSPGAGPNLILNTLLLGTGTYNRSTNKIGMFSISIRYDIYRFVASAIPSQTIRMCLVYDRQSNNGAPIFSDVFASRDQTGALVTDNQCWQNIDNFDRYTVLYDRSHFIPAMLGTAGQWDVFTPPGAELRGDIYLPLKYAEATFNGTAGTIADFKSGSLLWFAVTDASAGGNLQYDMNSRVRFIDC